MRRVTLDEALAMAMDGRITDSLSMAALMKLALLVERGELERFVERASGPGEPDPELR